MTVINSATISAGFAVGGGGGGAGIYKRRLPPVLGVKGSHIVDIKRRENRAGGQLAARSFDSDGEEEEEDEEDKRAPLPHGRRRRRGNGATQRDAATIGATQTEFSYHLSGGGDSGGGGGRSGSGGGGYGDPKEERIEGNGKNSNDHHDQIGSNTHAHEGEPEDDAGDAEIVAGRTPGLGPAPQPEFITVEIPALVQYTDGLYTTTVERHSPADAGLRMPQGFWREKLIARLKAKRTSAGGWKRRGRHCGTKPSRFKTSKHSFP